MTAYDEMIAWLARLEVTAGWDLKLERMRAALARRGHPEAGFPALHVAGTNGKGSTAALLDAVLTAAGWTTGLYTSPHLIDFTERIRVGGRTIPRETVVALVAELRADLDAAGIALTHFEFATLLACEWFRRVGVEVAVVEVGLGGRLDATNLVRPCVTAITSIGHDHEEFLGHGLAAIAGEKAGILKPGVPLALGPVVPEAERVIAARAAALAVPVVYAGRDAVLGEDQGGTLAFRGAGVTWDGLVLGLPGRFQRDNAAVALAALALVRERFPCPVAAVREGLRDVRWPGRLAVVGQDPPVVLDGAHNPEGVTALVGELPALVGRRPVTLVFAVMADKAWQGMVGSLLPAVERVIVTRVGRRGLPPAELAAALEGRVAVEVVEDPGAAVRRGIECAPGGSVLVTGSLFLVGRAYAELGVQALFRPWHPPMAGAREAPV